ncbi:MAG: gliding motility-associated C-terminal domain-containing protein [Bacteroidetes bacterium]|nr:gliding motility-associated C-terminal domain-containing protein [Bacteroidota bacterium]
MNTENKSLRIATVQSRIMLLLMILCVCVSHRSNAQVFWMENFGTGCNQAQLATSAAGSNGAWTETLSGTNDLHANEWYISGTEAGFPAGSCRDGCLGSASLNNQTLHVGSVVGAPSVLCPAGDCNALYDAGSFPPNNDVTTNKRIESPVINCAGKANIVLSFNYLENGDLLNDNATLEYFDGTTWNQLTDPPKTSLISCAGLGVWTPFSFSLPASANNNPNVRIGFRWINNNDAVGTGPSFAVDSITLTSNINVSANFTVDSITGGCAGRPRQFTDLSSGNPSGWLWVFPGGTPNFSIAQNPVVTYNLAGTYSVTLAVYNVADTDTIVRSNYITIANCNAPIADFTANNTAFCQNTCINFTDLSQNSPTSWLWSFPGSNTPVSNQQNPINICYTTPGFYDVQLIASNTNGSDTTLKSVYITVNNCPPPVAAFGSNSTGGCDTVCINFFDLSTNVPTSWHWYFPGATPDSSNAQNPTGICYTSDGLFDVTLVVVNGGGTDTMTKFSYINMSSVPTATINSDTTMPWGSSYQMLAGGGLTYHWYPAAGLDTTETPDPIATPLETTTYYCLISDGTCFTTRQLTITITHENKVFIPDAFSPNGDQKNDLFRIRGNNLFSARLTVFDRWGEKLYDSENMDDGWDGTWNGEKMSSGVYSYVATIVYKDGTYSQKTGSIALIR